MSAGYCTRAALRNQMILQSCKILDEHSVPQTLGRDPKRAVVQFSLDRPIGTTEQNKAEM